MSTEVKTESRSEVGFEGLDILAAIASRELRQDIAHRYLHSIPGSCTVFLRSLSQGCGSGSAWIRIHFLSWGRIQERKCRK